MCHKGKYVLLLLLVLICLFMMPVFAESSQLAVLSIKVQDPEIERIIAEEFRLALSDGTLDVGGSIVKTEGQLLSSEEDLNSVLVYGVPNFLDYDFETNGISRLIGDSHVHYETLVTARSANHDVVMNTHIKDGDSSSGFRTIGFNPIKPMVFNEILMAEYFASLGIHEYDAIHYLKANPLGFSGVLVKSQGMYWILPFEIKYVYFKFAHVKVMEAEGYFDALKSYIIEQKRMEQKKVGLKRLGCREINPSQWILNGVLGLCIVWVIFGALIAWKRRVA